MLGMARSYSKETTNVICCDRKSFPQVKDLNMERLLDSTTVYKCKGTFKKGTEEDLSRDKMTVKGQKQGAAHTASSEDGGRSQRTGG